MNNFCLCFMKNKIYSYSSWQNTYFPFKLLNNPNIVVSRKISFLLRLNMYAIINTVHINTSFINASLCILQLIDCLYNNFFQIKKNLTYLLEKFFLYFLYFNSTLLCKDHFHQLLVHIIPELYLCMSKCIHTCILTYGYASIHLNWTWVRSLGREDPLEKGNDYPLQYSGLEKSMNYVIHGFTKSWT